MRCVFCKVLLISIAFFSELDCDDDGLNGIDPAN